MLAPLTYERDLQRLFGVTINHILYDKQSLETLRNTTKTLWNQNYPSEPFDPPDEAIETDFQSSFDYDIAEAVQRQRLFFYQVSLPHYRSLEFLNSSLARYKMYLYLKSLHPDIFLVPCYDMDVCWHTHQIRPFLYQKETKVILGHVLPHDDSVNDRAPGSKLNNSDEITRKLWRQTFEEEFSRPGSMFRGIPPNGKLLSLISNTIQDDLLMGKSYLLELENLVWAVSDLRQAEKFNNRGQLHLWICLIAKQLNRGGWANSKQQVKLTCASNSTLTPNEKGHYCISMTPIDGKKEKIILKEIDELSIEFEIEHEQEKTSCFCFNYNASKNVAGSTFPLEFQIDGDQQQKVFENKISNYNQYQFSIFSTLMCID